jgi:hypothetical protein
MDVKLAATVAHLLARSDGAQLLSALGKGSPDTDLDILRAIGIQNPTANDVSEIEQFIAASNIGRDEHMQDVTRSLRNILIQDPKTMSIVGAINAASGLTKAFGNVSANNGNRLANAILAANRTNTAAQNELYGPSRREKAAEAYSENRRKRGENVKAVTDEISGAIDKTLGNFNNQDLAARSIAAAQNMPGTPGTLYQLINGMQSRSSKIGRS